MKRILLLLVLLLPLGLLAQSRLYRGNSTYSGNIIFTFDGRHIYRGNSTYSGNILYTLDGAIPIAALVALLL